MPLSETQMHRLIHQPGNDTELTPQAGAGSPLPPSGKGAHRKPAQQRGADGGKGLQGTGLSGPPGFLPRHLPLRTAAQAKACSDAALRPASWGAVPSVQGVCFSLVSRYTNKDTYSSAHTFILT